MGLQAHPGGVVTGEAFAAALPFPLVCAGIALTLLSAVLRGIATDGRIVEGWADATLAAALGCLVLALTVAWVTA